MAYSIAISNNEAMLQRRTLYDLFLETKGLFMKNLSIHDERLYVRYSTEEERDRAFDAFSDAFRSAVKIFSPVRQEERKCP